MGGNAVTPNNGVFDEAGTVLSFCGHPDYSHSPQVLHELYEVDRQKKWVHDQLLDFGITTNYDDTDYVWVVHQIVPALLLRASVQNEQLNTFPASEFDCD
jgi:hypothetical protein